MITKIEFTGCPECLKTEEELESESQLDTIYECDCGEQFSMAGFSGWAPVPHGENRFRAVLKPDKYLHPDYGSLSVSDEYRQTAERMLFGAFGAKVRRSAGIIQEPQAGYIPEETTNAK